MSDDKFVTEHESYVIIEANRVTSNKGVSLFGCSIKPNNTIRLRVTKAYVKRDLSKYWYHSTSDTILELELSYAQFAELITSLNTPGVPATLRYFNGDSIEECPFEDTKHRFDSEFSDLIKETLSIVSLLTTEVIKILDQKSLKKADRDHIKQILNKISIACSSSFPFISSQFSEQMSKVVEEAKAELDAYLSNMVKSKQADISYPSIPEL